MDAGMSHLHFAYMDYIARQSNPFTAVDEGLAAWGALKDTFRKGVTAATGAEVVFSGVAGRTIAAGTVLNRTNGSQYTLDAPVTISDDGYGSGSITAILPLVGSALTPADGNAVAGTVLALDAAIEGIVSTATAAQAITGGADIEPEEAFRSRVLFAYRSPASGGNGDDYRRWALEVSGVTRAWIAPRILGAGSLGVYIMCDGTDRTNHGFPEGVDGTATNEEYIYGKAQGDQLRVANYLFSKRPATTLIWVCSPIMRTINLDIGGIPDADSDVVKAIQDAVDEVYFDNGEPGGKIYISDLNLAIGAISGTRGFVLNEPSGVFIQLGAGELPVRGEITFSRGAS